ncbi:MAG: NAD(+)/NADH kinase [Candidatus Omnitrophica bacterium]|nr:NAD(+)/NADH kinase [Candidatus Omnitrophota bacterium]
MLSKPKILLLYKNSTYASYFLSSRRRFAPLQGLFNSREIQRFRQTHQNHFEGLSYVEAVLKSQQLKFAKICRGSSVDYSRFDLVISFGGDGTFLEAARNIKGQLIWGVNSDPHWSVGRFCCGTVENFEPVLKSVLKGKFVSKTFHRLRLTFNDGAQRMHALNDILICHQNPAAMSRYYVKLGHTKEEQRSSGMWISTAAGSSGGIHSAGGRILPDKSPWIQYRPRELHRGRGVSYQLKGAVLKSTQGLSVTSLMREGAVFVDGSHVRLPFSFGATVKINRSFYPLKVVWS